MINDIIFTTAFKDIERIYWKDYQRTNEEYYEYFTNLTKNIKYNLVVYLDDDIKNTLLKKYKFNSNIIFKNTNDVETFYNKYLEEEHRVINDNRFKNKIPLNRKNKPETIYAKYTLINHSKINFVKHTKKLFPDYKFYSWIDFGFVRDINVIPKNINIDKLPEKIIYQTLCYIPKIRVDVIKNLQTDEVVIAGSAFIIYNSLIEHFENLYENKIKQWQKNYICDDDQALVLQLFYENPELFCLVVDKKWFNIYNKLSL